MTPTNITPTRKASEIGFGIEIECNIPTTHQYQFPVGGYHRGVSVNLEGLSDWNTQSDGSVRSVSGYYSAEIVSPILRGESGLRQVVQMLDHLNAIGALVNPSCGLHVHVDVEGLTQAQITRLVKLFKYYEVAFYDLNGVDAQYRMDNHFCAPSTRWTGTRYQSLNQQHLRERHPHIEIRVWHGALKPEVVVSAIYMAVSLVSRTTAQETVKTSDLNRNKPTQVMAKFIRRFMQPDCMIVSDERPDDIWQTMMQEAIHSNRQR